MGHQHDDMVHWIIRLSSWAYLCGVIYAYNSGICTIAVFENKSIIPQVRVSTLNDWSMDITAREGETVGVLCNVTGVPRPEVTWYRHPASSKRHERQRIGQSGEMIIFQNVSRYCEDLYECVAVNGVPPAVSRQMRVFVKFGPEIFIPNKMIGQQFGKDTILECVIKANPQAQNFWFKDEQIQSKDGKYRVRQYDEGDHTTTLVLYIYNITQEDFGQYVCYASNRLGDDRENMYLLENLMAPRPVGPKYGVISYTNKPSTGSIVRPHNTCTSVLLVLTTMFIVHWEF